MSRLSSRPMPTFIRADGRALEIVQGFREEVLSYRPSVTPRSDWTSEQYAFAAAAKRRRFDRLTANLTRWHGRFDGARVLDVGCGDGANCLLLGKRPVARVVGIDLHLPLFAKDEKGAQARRLAAQLLREERPGIAQEAVQSRLPANEVEVDLPPAVRFLQMDATQMSFRDGSFDVVMSRSAMEHIKPVERAFAEMARVVRNGGLIYLGIDPFYWLRGCHKRGVVDIPWAHARLGLEDYRRFVAEREGEDAAEKRFGRLETLNRLTVRQWRQHVDVGQFAVLDWKEKPSSIGEKVLAQHPEVLETLLPGVTREDLLCERIEVWLRRP